MQEDSSELHRSIVRSLQAGSNVLLHGPGGTGKSFTIRQIAISLTNQGFKIACTATTGKAALTLNVPEYQIMARTLHSWAGVGLARKEAIKLATKIKSSKKYATRWNETDVLIIDEVSMLGAEFFKKLDYIARHVRDSSRPFGGLALLLSGDFMQLPPVKDEWVFNSEEWKSLNIRVVPMLDPKRYDDKRWFEVLLRIRKGAFTPEDIRLLQKRENAYLKLNEILTQESPTEVIKPTILFAKKVDVESHNNDELEKLPSETIVMLAEDHFAAKIKDVRFEEYLHQLDDAIPGMICLRVGAQVMLRANLDVGAGLVNGSRGVILEINESDAPEIKYVVKVRFLNGKIVTIMPHVWEIEDKRGKASRSQIPLILAWAITIHKVQGTTLDYAVADCGPSIFAYGQAYVALSRVRNIRGLFLSDFYPGSLKTSKTALKYVNEIEDYASEANLSISNIDQVETNDIASDVVTPFDGNVDVETQQTMEIENDGKCVVCWKHRVTHAPSPCGHLCLCRKCFSKIEENGKCPICNMHIDKIIKIYHSSSSSSKKKKKSKKK